MKRLLILEDSPERVILFRKNFKNAELVCVETSTECIEKLKNEKWWGLFLDHDLGGEIYVESGGDKETGYDVAEFLYNNPELKPEYVAFHSLNEPGRKNMKGLIKDGYEHPFIWTKEIYFDEIVLD